MKRGILVRGKVTDKATGRPILGYADYYAFADNPHLPDYPGFSRQLSRSTPLSTSRAVTRSSPCPAAG